MNKAITRQIQRIKTSNESLVLKIQGLLSNIDDIISAGSWKSNDIKRIERLADVYDKKAADSAVSLNVIYKDRVYDNYETDEANFFKNASYISDTIPSTATALTAFSFNVQYQNRGLFNAWKFGKNVKLRTRVYKTDGTPTLYDPVVSFLDTTISQNLPGDTDITTYTNQTVTIPNTVAKTVNLRSISGATLGKTVIFSGMHFLTPGYTVPFIAGEVINITGCTATGNNTVGRVSSVQGRAAVMSGISNFTASTEDKCVMTKIPNLISNGDFSGGTTGWSTYYSSIASSSGIISATGLGTNARSGIRQDFATVNFTANRKIYVRVKVLAASSLATSLVITLQDVGGTGTSQTPAAQVSPTINTWYTISGIATLPAGSGVVRILSNAAYNTAADSLNAVSQTDDFLAIDMGIDSSNPLYNKTQAQMDSLFGTWSNDTAKLFSCIPSPTNIHTALASVSAFNIRRTGKNLIAPTATFPYTINGITMTYDSDTGEYILNGTATNVATTYIGLETEFARFGMPLVTKTTFVSGTITNSYVSVHQNYLWFSAGGSVATFYDGTAAGTSITSNLTAAIYSNYNGPSLMTWFYICSGVVLTNARFRIQTELGSTATDFEKPTILTTPLTLKDTSNNQLYLRGIPSTYNADGSVATWIARDKVIRALDGKWYLQQNVSDESAWTTLSEYTPYRATNTYFFRVPANTGDTPSFSTTKTYVLTNAIPAVSRDTVCDTDAVGMGLTAVGHDLSMRLLKTDVDAQTGGTTAQKAIAYLTSLTAKGYYPKSSPTYTELCTADQTALNALATIAPNTSFGISGSSQQITLSVDYDTIDPAYESNEDYSKAKIFNVITDTDYPAGTYLLTCSIIDDDMTISDYDTYYANSSYSKTLTIT